MSAGERADLISLKLSLVGLEDIRITSLGDQWRYA